MQLPLVSICIPTYNAAAFLEPCLASAVGQTYRNIEILICDDGSTDDTVEIVKHFQEQYSYVKLIQNSSNLGMVNNWNYCIEQAQGKWIKFVFQDDILETVCVEEMMDACTKVNAKVAVCRRDFILHDDIEQHIGHYFKEVPKMENVFPNKSFISPKDLAGSVKRHLIQNFIGEPTCYLFARQLAKEQGLFNTQLKQLVDYEFIARLGLINGLAFIPKTLAHFRVHGKSESSANNQRDKHAQLRNIAAETGDSIVLLYQYLHNPAFEKLRKVTGENLLDDYIRQLYYSECKHKGAKLVNEALHHIRSAYPELGELKYSFLKYIIYRRRMKKRLRSLKEQ